MTNTELLEIRAFELCSAMDNDNEVAADKIVEAMSRISGVSISKIDDIYDDAVDMGYRNRLHMVQYIVANVIQNG